MNGTDVYILDEPVAWTNVSSFTPWWMERYISQRPHTSVTVKSEELDRGLFSFAQTFDYDRSHYAVFVAHAESLRSTPSWEMWASLLPFLHSPAKSPESTPQESVRPSASSYADELIRWLGCTYDELAAMTGISRSAFFYWRRTGATPRSSNLRPLLRLHSLVGALVRRFSSDGALAWLAAGDPAPMDILLQGRMETAEDMFRRSLMTQPDRRERYSRRVDDSNVELELVEQPPPSSRRSARRPKRGSLPGP